MAAVISPVAGSRTEPKDSYAFVRGNSATFKVIFTSNGIPITVDSATTPHASILQPAFLSSSDVPLPTIIATLPGSLVSGQQFEYQFDWTIPASITPMSDYIVSYSGTYGNILLNFSDEYFTIMAGPGMVGIKDYSYATVDDVRMNKSNIDDYISKGISPVDLTARNNFIEYHLRKATSKLREELTLNKQRGMSENYKIFCCYYAIWSILLSSRGEDGSSVSDSNIMFWRTEWENILRQEKRKGGFQGINLGRG